MICTLCSSTTYATESDTSGHWAESTLNEWQAKGLLKGYEDGTMRPNNDVSKAEFIALVNRVFGYYIESEKNYVDIQENKWYSKDSKIAKANGYLEWYKDSALQPEESILREEVFVILATIMQLEPSTDLSGIAGFSDRDELSNWSLTYIDALISNGYVKGNPDNTIDPSNSITRAEAITMLDRVMGQLIDEPGTYGEADDDVDVHMVLGNLTVTSKDVILQNMLITGDLILSAGIADGDIDMINVTVKGRTIINGGGEHSITISNSTLGEIRIYKINGEIRVVLEGSEADRLVIQSGGILVGQYDNTEVVIEPNDGEEVILDGNFNSIIVNSNVNINVTEGSVVQEMTFNTGAKVTGKGEIFKVRLNSSGVSMEQTVKEVILGIDSSGINESVNGLSTTVNYNTNNNHLVDIVRPTANSFIPTNSTTSIAIDANLQISFDEAVQVGSGNLIIKKYLDDSTVISIPATDTSQVVCNDNIVTIDPTLSLEEETQYYIVIDEGFIKDMATSPNAYIGIADKDIWKFTSGGDGIAPLVIRYAPVDDSYNVAVDDDLIITFDENITAVNGKNIQIYDGNDQLIETIQADDGAQVTINNNIATIQPSSSFEIELHYYILIDSGAFVDQSSSANAYVGIVNKNTWNFHTKETTAPSLVASAETGDLETEIKFNAEINENGKAYYVIVENQIIPMPSAEDIKNHNISNTLYYGEIDLEANVTSTKVISNLPPDKGYYIYLVAEDMVSNLAAVQELTAISKLVQGDGTADNPMKIWYIDDLANIAPNTTIHYILMRDLSFSLVSSYKTYTDAYIHGDWANDSPHNFKGIFDGNNKIVDSLTIVNGSNSGFFAGIGAGGEIIDLGLENVYIIGTSTLGAFTGSNSGLIKNSYMTGVVKVTQYEIEGGVIVGGSTAGGIVGSNSVGGRIEECYVEASISVDDDYVGGIAGNNWGSITKCYSSGSVLGGDSILFGSDTNEGAAGGIAGSNGGTISDSYSVANVTAMIVIAGGISGTNTGAITNCYSTGFIEGINYVSGIAALNGTGSISNCLVSNSAISGLTEVARIANAGTLTNNYATNNMLIFVDEILTSGTSDQDSTWGGDIESMLNIQAQPLLGWNFTTIWEIKPGARRPTLIGVGDDSGR